MNLRMPPIGFILPLASAAVTGIVLVPEASLLAPLPSISVSKVTVTESALALPELSDPRIAATAFADRPLLAENRQNPEIPPAQPIEPEINLEPLTEVDVQPEAPQTPPALKMTGHVQVRGQNRALLQNAEDGSEVWVGVGDSIEAWTLVEITQDRVELLKGEEVITIKLFE